MEPPSAPLRPVPRHCADCWATAPACNSIPLASRRCRQPRTSARARSAAPRSTAISPCSATRRGARRTAQAHRVRSRSTRRASSATTSTIAPCARLCCPTWPAPARAGAPPPHLERRLRHRRGAVLAGDHLPGTARIGGLAISHRGQRPERAGARCGAPRPLPGGGAALYRGRARARVVPTQAGIARRPRRAARPAHSTRCGPAREVFTISPTGAPTGAVRRAQPGPEPVSRTAIRLRPDPL